MEITSLKMNSTFSTSSKEGNCYFLAHRLEESSIVQIINLKSFSVLIDTERGRFNVSAYLGCVERKFANVSIICTFLSDNGLSTQQFIG